MAHARTSRRRASGSDYWPGFVDAMATLLLVMTFLLSVFMLANYFVTQEISGKDTALQRLTRQITQLTELLALEQTKKQKLEETISSLSASLAASDSEKSRLQGLVGLESEKAKSASSRLAGLSSTLDEQKKISDSALAKVELLNHQLAALRRQIAALNQALDAARERESQNQSRIADLGKRLNIALARKVQELSRYRSEFFGRLRQVLGNRDDIRVVGDRFVFQSEVLFSAGSAQLNPAAYSQLDKFAQALVSLEGEIPEEIDWVLRVDGHTDATPIQTPQFPSNWELSTARAISVVRYFISRGVKPKRLMAAGFGQFKPIAQGDSPEDYRRNRRIELKLTTP
jgi:chemotaxis protein MotB